MSCVQRSRTLFSVSDIEGERTVTRLQESHTARLRFDTEHTLLTALL
jgi:hypothetical protein